MNCQRAAEFWDDARDRALSAADQVAFDQHLRSCSRCMTLWRRESRMLGALAGDPAPGEADRFKWNVMVRAQQAERAERASAPPASIDPLVMKLAPWAAMAAAVALIVSLWAVMRPAGDPRTPTDPTVSVAVTRPDAASAGGSPGAGSVPTHPVSVLVQDLTRGIEQPQRLRESIEKTTSYLSLNQLAALLGGEAAPTPTESSNTRG